MRLFYYLLYKKILLAFAAVCMASFAFAQDAPLWMRHCAISPDGTTIAFIYKGDIYTVPVNGGHIGYVHIKGMDSPSFRKIYSELLGRNRNKETVVVDVRHNGGGWLYDDVVMLLSGREYERFVPRGQYIGSDLFNKWLKSSCMLVCEDNCSNAHGTPFAGTMTAVWWERQIDPSIVFGISQVGCMDMQGNYLENHTLQPDILIYNTPEEVVNGNDVQLKAEVEHLLSQLTSNPQ